MAAATNGARIPQIPPGFPPTGKQRDEYNQEEQTQPFPRIGKVVE
jgi:hypothetical protein